MVRPSVSGILLEWRAIDGESPVDDDQDMRLVEFLSNARLE